MENPIESTAEATAPEVQETEGAQSAEVTTHDGEAAQAAPAVSDSERLKELVKKSKDPEKASSLTEDELDFLEKHDFGNKPPKEDKEPEEVPEEAKEKPEPKAKVDPLADVLKELGAKDAKDILPKVKELRKQLTGRDAQTVTRLQKDLDTVMGRVRNEKALWDDVRGGKPEAVQNALAFVEKAYGIKLVPADQAQPVTLTGDGLIPRDKFIDGESADLVNGVLSKLTSRLDAWEKKSQTEEQKRVETAATEKATNDAIDEMVTLAGKKGLETLSQIPNLRQAIKEWYQGKDDPRFEVFSQVMQLANERHVDLDMAWAYLRANGADLEIAKAKQDGIRQAYEQKPSKTLSGMQGKGQSEYTNYTDAQFQEMTENPRKVPQEWFDDNDQLVKSRVPKRGHKWLFPSEAKEE
jgi:hypothetical protein